MLVYQRVSAKVMGQAIEPRWVSVLRSFLLWPLNPWFLLVKYSGQSRGPDQAMVRQCLL